LLFAYVISLLSVASVEQQLTIYRDMLMVATIFIGFACSTDVPQPISWRYRSSLRCSSLLAVNYGLVWAPLILISFERSRQLLLLLPAPMSMTSHRHTRHQIRISSSRVNPLQGGVIADIHFRARANCLGPVSGGSAMKNWVGRIAVWWSRGCFRRMAVRQLGGSAGWSARKALWMCRSTSDSPIRSYWEPGEEACGQGIVPVVVAAGRWSWRGKAHQEHPGRYGHGAVDRWCADRAAISKGQAWLMGGADHRSGSGPFLHSRWNPFQQLWRWRVLGERNSRDGRPQRYWGCPGDCCSAWPRGRWQDRWSRTRRAAAERPALIAQSSTWARQEGRLKQNEGTSKNSASSSPPGVSPLAVTDLAGQSRQAKSDFSSCP